MKNKSKFYYIFYIHNYYYIFCKRNTIFKKIYKKEPGNLERKKEGV